jgi:YegS/Rv2252/BmrU family lipid kinase
LSVAIIINPISGGARPDAARTRAELALRCVERHGDRGEVFVTERQGHARALAKAAARRGVRLVLAWGGDGTINEVASALTFDETPLGIVPSGSGNGLARELGISRRPEAAIADALRAEPWAMDVGELEGRLFVNIAGIGIDAWVASRFNDPENRRRGLFGYAGITAGALVTYRPACYRISSDHGLVEVRAILVCAANSGQFGHDATIAPRARVDDGLLDVVVVAEDSRLKTLRSLPRLFNGTIERVPGCTIFRARQATIESDEPMTFHVDGEPVHGGTCLRLRVHPGALRIAVRPAERPRLP